MTILAARIARRPAGSAFRQRRPDLAHRSGEIMGASLRDLRGR